MKIWARVSEAQAVTSCEARALGLVIEEGDAVTHVGLFVGKESKSRMGCEFVTRTK